MPAAVSGLLAGSAAVRACALAALVNVPTLAEGLAPESSGVTAVLALARHDASEDNAAAAKAIWQQVGWGGRRLLLLQGCVHCWDCLAAGLQRQVSSGSSGCGGGLLIP
jgi:hypothetical protein